MKKICFVIDKGLSPNSYAFLFPLLLNKNQIDHEIEIFFKLPIKNYDYIFIDSKYYNKKFKSNDFEFIKNDLENLRKKCNKLIYCDNEASIFINNLIFDYVDIYLKGRLPNNLNIYKKKLYGQREFTEYYNKKFGIIDSTESYSNIIEDKNLKKFFLAGIMGFVTIHIIQQLKKNI